MSDRYRVVSPKQLTAYYRASGVARSTLAEYCGVSPVLISKIVTGERTVSREVATRMEHMLRVVPGALFAPVSPTDSDGVVEDRTAVPC